MAQQKILHFKNSSYEKLKLILEKYLKIPSIADFAIFISEKDGYFTLETLDDTLIFYLEFKAMEIVSYFNQHYSTKDVSNLFLNYFEDLLKNDEHVISLKTQTEN